LKTAQKAERFVSNGWNVPVFNPVWISRGRDAQRDALLKVMQDHKEDADIIAGASWLLHATTQGYYHVASKRNPDKVLTTLGTTMYVWMKNKYYDTDDPPNEYDFCAWYNLDYVTGALSFLGWSYYPTGDDTYEWLQTMIVNMLYPLIDCAAEDVNSGWTYAISDYSAETGGCLLDTPDPNCMPDMCGEGELMFSSKVQTAPASAAIAEPSAKKVKGEDKTSTPVSSVKIAGVKPFGLPHSIRGSSSSSSSSSSTSGSSSSGSLSAESRKRKTAV